MSADLIDEYRTEGHCWVITGSHQRDRGLKARLPDARAYYERLEGSSRRVAVFSPYREGAGPVEFNFDHSFDYYPAAYQRPGPEIVIYRPRDCA